MGETIRKKDEKKYIPKRLRKRDVCALPKQINVRRNPAVKDDAEFLVQTGNCADFIELETSTSILYYNRNGLDSSVVQW